MKRVLKKEDSEILKKEIKYKKGSNKNLEGALLSEQKELCAYTETYLGRTDLAEIDHFDPTLKYEEDDSYLNWFAIKARWNREKASKWKEFQPILHPTAEDFEKRIKYTDGEYSTANLDDIEAKNLIKLLKLDDKGLENERKSYIERQRENIEIRNKTPQEYFDKLLKIAPNLVYFIRAIEEEFKVKINFSKRKNEEIQ